jgi:type II secretory pathway pseudopilin PulG
MAKAAGKNVIAVLALVVSVVSLGLTGYVSFFQLDAQRDAVELQGRELDQAQRQFDQMVGRLEVTATVDMKRPETEEWLPGPRSGERMPYDAFANELYAFLKVSNTGQAPVSVDGTGIVMNGDDSQLQRGSVWCAPAEEDAVSTCAFPVEIAPQQAYEVLFRIDGLRSGLTCNPYVEDNGLVAAVKTLGGDLVLHETGVKVPMSNDCDSPDPQPPAAED